MKVLCRTIITANTNRMYFFIIGMLLVTVPLDIDDGYEGCGCDCG